MKPIVRHLDAPRHFGDASRVFLSEVRPASLLTAAVHASCSESMRIPLAALALASGPRFGQRRAVCCLNSRSLNEALENWRTKRSPQDFQVSEIRLDGSVAALLPGESLWAEGSLVLPPSDGTPSASYERDAIVALVEDGSHRSSQLLDALIFAAKVAEAPDRKTVDALYLPTEGMSKDDRAAFHRELREAAGTLVDSKTDTAAVPPRLRVWAKTKGNRAQSRWTPGSPEHLKFVVAKENLSTLDALDELARRIGAKPERLSYSGAKDKVASTAQWVSLWRPPPDAAVRLALPPAKSRLRKSARLEVGRFEKCAEPLRLGGLRGNRFRLVLRGLGAEGAATLEAAARSVRGSRCGGQLNLFGTQRFGVGEVPNSMIGEAILRRDFGRALALCLDRVLGNAHRGPEGGEGKALLDPACLAHLAEMGKKRGVHSPSEIKLLRAIAEHGAADGARALQALPRPLRRLFVESWQSALWNAVAKHRVSPAMLSRSPGARSGDLVLRSKASGAPLTAWDLPETSLDDIDVHRVAEGDAFGLDVVVVPLLGTSVELPGWFGEGVDESLAPGDLRDMVLREHPVSTYTLKGSYRHIVAAPRNICVIPDSDGVESSVVSFDLPSGSYATVLADVLAGHTPSLC